MQPARRNALSDSALSARGEEDHILECLEGFKAVGLDMDDDDDDDGAGDSDDDDDYALKVSLPLLRQGWLASTTPF